jgi:hypothetical protein
MTVAQAVIVDYGGHLDARAKLARLGLRGENRDLRSREILENGLGHKLEWTARVMFEDKETVLGADTFHLLLERGGDFARSAIGNYRDAFIWLKTQAHFDRIPGAWKQLGIDWMVISAVGH